MRAKLARRRRWETSNRANLGKLARSDQACGRREMRDLATLSGHKLVTRGSGSGRIRSVDDGLDRARSAEHRAKTVAVGQSVATGSQPRPAVTTAAPSDVRCGENHGVEKRAKSRPTARCRIGEDRTQSTVSGANSLHGGLRASTEGCPGAARLKWARMGGIGLTLPRLAPAGALPLRVSPGHAASRNRGHWRPLCGRQCDQQAVLPGHRWRSS